MYVYHNACPERRVQNTLTAECSYTDQRVEHRMFQNITRQRRVQIKECSTCEKCKRTNPDSTLKEHGYSQQTT